MATVTDVEVANQSFPNVRQDLNDILEALATNFSADAEPTTTYPNQFWYETDTNLLYIRNEANDAWVTLASINQTSGEWEPRTAVIQAVDSAGLALKTDEGTTRFSISDAGQVSFQNYSFPTADGTANQALVTDGAGTLSFADAGGSPDKIEEGNSSVEVVDTGTGRIEFTTDGSEAARIDSSQNILVGTTDDDPALNNDASGISLKATGQIQASATSDNALTVNRNSAGDGNLVVFNKSGTTHGSIRSASGGIGFGSGSSATEGLRIDSSQNLLFNSGFGSVATAYGCRAWVNFNGTGTVAIREDGNVSSITDNGTGDYTVNFATAMPDANYAAFVSARNGASGNPITRLAGDGYAAGSCRIYPQRATSGGMIDVSIATFSAFR